MKPIACVLLAVSITCASYAQTRYTSKYTGARIDTLLTTASKVDGYFAKRLESTASFTFNLADTIAYPIYLSDASIRQGAFWWNESDSLWYMLADVVDTSDTNHPDTFTSEISLFAGSNLYTMALQGVAIPKGSGSQFDGKRTATPCGMVYSSDTLYACYATQDLPYSYGNTIGIASSHAPLSTPWTKTGPLSHTG